MNQARDEFQSIGRSLREPSEAAPKVILISGAEYGRMEARKLIESFKEEIESKAVDVYKSAKPFRKDTYPKRYLERN